MPITLDQVTKEIDLQLPDSLPKSLTDDIKAEVGDFVLVSILDYVGEGKSPVSGRAFKQLDKNYADEEKGGRRTPNLELEGDMLRSLEFKNTSKGIEIGIFDSSQAPKAYNHNVGDTLPKRQFIPEPRQRFVGEIEKGINDLVNRRLVSGNEDGDEGRARRTPPRSTPSDERSTPEIRASRAEVSAPVARSFNPLSGISAFDSIIRNIIDGE
jgi:hypothetical protein